MAVKKLLLIVRLLSFNVVRYMAKDADLLSSLKSNELMEANYYIVRYVNQLVAVTGFFIFFNRRIEIRTIKMMFGVSCEQMFFL